MSAQSGSADKKYWLERVFSKPTNSTDPIAKTKNNRSIKPTISLFISGFPSAQAGVANRSAIMVRMRVISYFGNGSEDAGAKGATEFIASSTPDWVFALRNSKAPTMTVKNKSAKIIDVRVMFGIAYFSMNKKFQYYLSNCRMELFQVFLIVETLPLKILLGR